MLAATLRWIDVNILSLGRELRLSYLPPLMVYLAFGISGLTGIVGSFYVKDYLSLSVSDLAALGFWVGIPFVLKMPIGHVVDLIWRWKSWLVFLGAGLIAASLLIMVGLLTDRAAMAAVMALALWYILRPQPPNPSCLDTRTDFAILPFTAGGVDNPTGFRLARYAGNQL